MANYSVKHTMMMMMNVIRLIPGKTAWQAKHKPSWTSSDTFLLEGDKNSQLKIKVISTASLWVSDTAVDWSYLSCKVKKGFLYVVS